MPNAVTQITWDEFVDRFVPQPNHLDENASYDGFMFETFGDELVYIREQDPALVWTILDTDDEIVIASGLHFVNRLGYLVCAAPVENDEFFEVVD